MLTKGRAASIPKSYSTSGFAVWTTALLVTVETFLSLKVSVQLNQSGSSLVMGHGQDATYPPTPGAAPMKLFLERLALLLGSTRFLLAEPT